jgi:hypothetical protein
MPTWERPSIGIGVAVLACPNPGAVTADHGLGVWLCQAPLSPSWFRCEEPHSPRNRKLRGRSLQVHATSLKGRDTLRMTSSGVRVPVHGLQQFETAGGKRNERDRGRNLLRNENSSQHHSELARLVARAFSDSRRCVVYTPRATNSAPSRIIIERTSSPLLSIEVTSFRSTMGVCVGWRSRDARQFETSSTTECFVRLPWRIHLCSRALSVTVILSIFLIPTD